MSSSQHPACIWIAIFATACASKPRAAAELAAPGASAVAASAPAAADGELRPPFVMPYPRAAWRLAPRAELARTVLWVSQILIRHTESRNAHVAFQLGAWDSVPAPPTRQREEALAFAQQLAEGLVRDPEQFADLARLHSEDLVSREDGGDLGGVMASDLASWPQVLDALAALRPGQVSEVVETRFGFHIFRRGSAPPEAELSGAHIVIGHERAQWLQVVARADHISHRTREQALALATDVFRQAQAHPKRFARLVDRYSESCDAAAQGDFGNWSTREPNPYPGRMLRLQALAPGEVAPPIETRLGFEIVQRTPSRPRPQHAARLLRLYFNPDAAATDPDSRATVRALAEKYARALARAPEQFEAIRAEAPGMKEVFLPQWAEGRGDPTFTLPLERLAPGQVAFPPLLLDDSYLVAQTITPGRAAELVPELDLPAPARPDLDDYLLRIRPAQAEEWLRGVAQQAQLELALPDEAASKLGQLHHLLGDNDDRASEAARLAAFHELLERSRSLLGENHFARYLALLINTCTAALLDPQDVHAQRGL
jgi:hypothetical protein